MRLEITKARHGVGYNENRTLYKKAVNSLIIFLNQLPARFKEPLHITVHLGIDIWGLEVQKYMYTLR